MPMESVPDGSTQQPYCLVVFDKEGRETRNDPDAAQFGGVLSWRIMKELEEQPFTDVFLLCHGWMGDVPAAKDQCAAWIGAMLACREDRRQARPGFRPLLVGLHWPSLPWGDESLGRAGDVSFAPGDDLAAALAEDAAAATADGDEARRALRTIFAAALADAGTSGMPAEVADAYRTLRREAGLADGGLGAAPGSDADGFDPEQIFQEEAGQSDGMPSFGLSSLREALLAPLRVLSFWKMKSRALQVGESGAAALLRSLQAAADGRGVRFHLMGHSFGCIVVSAAVAGASDPVHAMLLAQGAMSLWSCCASIPAAPGQAGYFRRIVAGRKAAGPILTTMSMRDTANRVFYPRGAGIAGQLSFAPGELPAYGAAGCFGLQGPGLQAVGMDMPTADGRCGFQGGRIYNLEASRIICNGSGARGAHNDIVHPEVAHAFWQAVMAA